MTDLGRRAYEIVRDAMSADEGVDWPPWGELSVAEQRGWWIAQCDLEEAFTDHHGQF